ncbi:MAG: NfeD family protein [Dehalococcoidia bacterium]|nr:NfeD family protein [Dehalococcoidia bacterium]
MSTHQRQKKEYFIYTIVTTLIEEGVLAAVVLLVLPRFGLDLPLWLLIVLMAAWAVHSCIMYRLGAKAIARKPAVGAETLLGARGKTTTPLTPEGYLRIGSELWRARSTAGNIDEGCEVIIREISGLTLHVMPPESEC